MLTSRQYWTLTAIAAVSVVLVIVNIVMLVNNRAAQKEINSRAQFIQQSAQLEVLYREMVKALADLSVKNQDKDLRDLLTTHGVTVNVSPSPGADTGRRQGAR
jgi:hypothetical protein